MENISNTLREFIEFLRNKDDVFYAFDDTEDAINEFISKNKRNQIEPI